MRIAVCIKQVPAGSAKMDADTGTLLRTAAGSTLNPWDGYAIEAALQAAEATGGSVCAVSMGPASAEAVLRDALALGADEGVLLCDRAIAGADVYVTAYTLAQGLRALGGFDMVFCGQQTTDGDTAQLPFSLAVQLGIPVAGWVKRIEDIRADGITVLQELSGGTQRLALPCPALLAVGREAVRVRVATLKNKLASRKAEITTLTLKDMQDKDAGHYGLQASPTRVVKVYRPQVQAKAQPLRLDAAEAAMRISQEIGGGRHG